MLTSRCTFLRFAATSSFLRRYFKISCELALDPLTGRVRTTVASDGNAEGGPPGRRGTGVRRPGRYAGRDRDRRATSERTRRMTAPTIYSSAALGCSGGPKSWRVALPGPGRRGRRRAFADAAALGRRPEKSIGAWTILAIRNAIEDAGVKPGEVEGLVFDPGPPPAPGGRRMSRSRRTSWPRSRHLRPVRRADPAERGVAGEEHARADRPEVRDGRSGLHVECRGRGRRGGGPRHGPGGAVHQGLAQHPRPVRRTRD